MILSAIWRGPKAAFQYPIQAAAPAAVPTAVMVPWFRPTRGAARFFEKLPAENARQAAIAATWTQFEQLMRARIPPPTHAAIVLWRAGESLLTTEQRDRLWAAFRVPVFEQIIGDRGELLAAECEAHAGLHIEWPSFRPSGLRLEPAACPCGRKTPRLTVRQDHAPAGSPPSHSRKAVSG